MRKFNDDDMVRLLPYEDKLRKAYYSKYITGITKDDFDAVYSIFKEVIGHSSMHFGCSHCELSVFSKVGHLYFKRKEEKDENN